ncbi:tyrosine-type recombinase/integrase [Nocardioides hwasunensis]|uniref:Site-specific integrase n=1 Tax=Nocardioides hwasunensis TaxID=397258 RepID=A0ABR8MIZ7_9ACTN|nr:site-specific integrase [Nocardioides hwasunensis]MBD3915888.1 site-specific integrase [Nocardioides hwasunensis]
MARPAALPYTLGKITVVPHPTMPKTSQARGYYRDDNNTRREVTVSVKSKSEETIRRALQAKVDAAEKEFRGGDTVLNDKTSVSQAADVWLDWKDREGKSTNTMRDYRGYVKNSVKGSSLANLTIGRANDVARIEAWLTTIADERGPAAAKGSRKVLSGILALAERRGAIPSSVMHRVRTPGVKPGSAGDRKCSNEDCDYDCGKRHLDTRRAFTPEEALLVQETADTAKADVGDLSAFLFGTGVRIHEALHCVSWTDLDLDAATVHVRGTKTDQADRVLAMSPDLAERLRTRAENYGTKGLVFGVTYFATKAGQPRDRNNVSKALRRVFATAGVQWAGTHTFRRTVASWMDEHGCALAEIANQLGHADTNVTAGYLGRKTQPTRAASVMVLPSNSPRLRAV